MILFEKSLDKSTGFSILIAQLCRMKFKKKILSMIRMFYLWNGIENNFTLLFLFGVILGCFIWTYSTNQFPLNEKYFE